MNLQRDKNMTACIIVEHRITTKRNMFLMNLLIFQEVAEPRYMKFASQKILSMFVTLAINSFLPGRCCWQKKHGVLKHNKSLSNIFISKNGSLTVTYVFS